MNKKIIIKIITILVAVILLLIIYIFSANNTINGKSTKFSKVDNKNLESNKINDNNSKDLNLKTIDKISNDIKFGTQTKNGFIVDDELIENEKTYHFSSYFPDDYDSNKSYKLYIALPGWEGLYFQGVGTNLYEQYPFIAKNYDNEMIIISPQLDDWGEQSANDTIFLTEYMLEHYNIDKNQVLISGVSGGGETLSIVLGKRPELYKKALHMISTWDGDYETLANQRTPLYIAIGEHDSYYGSSGAKKAYQNLHELYEKQGLSEEEISKILILDVKPDSYFESSGYENNQHVAEKLYLL